NCLSADTCNRMLALMGPSRFKDLMFTGRLMTAAEAGACGLLSRLVEPANLERTVRELATEIASRAPLTIRAIKEITRRLIARQRLAPGEDRDLGELCYMSGHFKEGGSALLG